MSFFTTFMKNVKEFYSEINAATLTGAIDVIVVEQEDGSFKSSPFHVRFGKMGVLKAREKVVDLEINGEPVDIWMKLDDTGAAFFVEDLDEDDENSLLLSELTSPLPNRMGHYFEKAAEVNKSQKSENDAENELVTLEEEEEDESKRKVRKKRKKRRELRLTRSGSRMAGDDMFDMDDLNDADTEDETQETDVTIKSISELIDETESLATFQQEEPSRVSFSSGYYSEPELPERRQAAALMSQSVDQDIFSLQTPASTPIQVSQTFSEPSLDNLEDQCNEDVGIWRWGELPKQEDSARGEEGSKSWFNWSNKSQPKEQTVGVYLDDIADDPSLMATYIGTYKADQADPLATDPGYDEKMDLKPAGTEPLLDVIPDMALSLCGRGSPAEREGITPDLFLSREMSHQDFVEKIRENQNFLSEKEVLVRLNEKYVSWETAGPILMSCLLYKKPLPDDLISSLTKDCPSVNLALPADQDKEATPGNKSSSWFSWFGGKSQPGIKHGDIQQEDSPQEVTVDHTKEDVVDVKQEQIAPSHPEEIISEKKIYRKTMRLSSEQLAKLNLKRGSNEVEFSVTTAFQGTTRCRCHIYLWHHSDKVVISDIDGTITKSDVLGHLLPVIGRDWAQSGVAQLYTKIRNNGYQIMYLSARAIGQASITKDYLQSLKQGDVCLPEGPLFLNPDSLIHAFKREVIDRNPEEFKIRCLKDIQSLFEGKNPFFAGYGNRSNDAYAYRAVGIPVSRIFTINPAGELKHELTQNFQTSYDEQEEVVDFVFPLIGCNDFDPEFEIQKFSSFCYWFLPPEALLDIAQFT